MDRFCLGTAQWGMDYGVANTSGQPPINAIKEILIDAKNNGVKFLDTAQAYGNSEEVIGKLLKELNYELQFSVISKLKPNFEFHNFDNLLQACNSSLEKLNIKTLWGLLLHRPQINGDKHIFLKAIVKLKQLNKIKNFGVSVYSPQEALQFIKMEEVDIIQVPFNVLDKRFLDSDFFNIAAKLNKKVFIRSVYLQGLLLLNPLSQIPFKLKWAEKDLVFFHDFIYKNKLNSKQFLINSILKKVKNSILVIGVETIEQYKENLNIFKICKIPSSVFQNWWSSLPNFPERLLNPSLW